MGAVRGVAEEAQFRDRTVVVVLPDGAERYRSTILFADVFTDREKVQ